jgi:hypothetical protein
MNRSLLGAAFGGIALCALLAPALAHAQDDDDLLPSERNWVSPERFIIETRFGPYKTDRIDLPAFHSFFSDDSGPALGIELDVIAYRLDDLVYVTGGGGIATMHFTGNTLDMETEQATSEENDFSIMPLELLASVRIDALPRKLGIPFILTGKIGYEWARWSTDSGSQEDANGWSVGLTYGAQLALDLDTFEPRAARSMDEEWGINHSFLFFELYEFSPSKQSVPIGNLQWCAGLGFTF